MSLKNTVLRAAVVGALGSPALGLGIGIGSVRITVDPTLAS